MNAAPREELTGLRLAPLIQFGVRCIRRIEPLIPEGHGKAVIARLIIEKGDFISAAAKPKATMTRRELENAAIQPRSSIGYLNSAIAAFSKLSEVLLLIELNRPTEYGTDRELESGLDPLKIQLATKLVIETVELSRRAVEQSHASLHTDVELLAKLCLKTLMGR